MIELVFVIVVLGILGAIAIPRLAATRDDAILVKGKSQISAIRSGIAMQKSKRLLEGTTPFILASLDTAALNTDDERLFNFADGNASNVLEYPIFSKQNHDGSWVKTAANQYDFTFENGTTISFDYNSTTGVFGCGTSADCLSLTQ